MGTIIAISNQKGGVGKTTSTISIAAELAMIGQRVLVIDFDPQGNATSGLGVELKQEGEDLYDVFFRRIPLSAIIAGTTVPNLYVAPSSKDLVGIEIEIGKQPGRELILKTELKLLHTDYDYVFIDCPPSCGLLTLNALGAASQVLIPLQAEYYALEGLSALLETIEFVQNTFNPGLSILGVFLTMYDVRTNLSAQVEAEARQFFQGSLFESRIPRNIRLSEAPSYGQPIALYAPQSQGAVAYHDLALAVHKRCLELISGQRSAINS